MLGAWRIEEELAARHFGSRQKMQEKYPELTDVTTMIHRLDKEQEYREYARC